MRRRILAMSFVESLATIYVERGIYFFAENKLHFTNQQNLAMALLLGLCMAGGALSSHKIAERLGERRMLFLVIVSLAAAHATLILWHDTTAVLLGSAVTGALNGLKWPIIESYVGAGRKLKETARMVGCFNLSWASGVPVAIATTGFLITQGNHWLFVACALMNLVAMVLCLGLPKEPEHWDEGHPERPDEAMLSKLRVQLRASRIQMWVSYAALYVLAAVTPRILRVDFGLTIVVATVVASLIDVGRGISFVLFQLWEGWHGRRIGIVVAMLLIPAGFVLVIVGKSVAVVIIGELLFGISAGLVYYASLYYALLVRNAAVDAGGAHEGLIGLGFAAGPLLALGGGRIAAHVGGEGNGYLITVGLLFVICALFVAKQLVHPADVPNGDNDVLPETDLAE